MYVVCVCWVGGCKCVCHEASSRCLPAPQQTSTSRAKGCACVRVRCLTVQHLRESGQVLHLLHRHAHLLNCSVSTPRGHNLVAQPVQALRQVQWSSACSQVLAPYRGSIQGLMCTALVSRRGERSSAADAMCRGVWCVLPTAKALIVGCKSPALQPALLSCIDASAKDLAPYAQFLFFWASLAYMIHPHAPGSCKCRGVYIPVGSPSPASPDLTCQKGR